MNAPLVGLCGARGVGKDTFAGYLGYRRIAFADPVRELALEINPSFRGSLVGSESGLRRIVEVQGWDFAKDVYGVREFLQNLGVGVRQVIGASTWIDAAFRQYDPAVSTVITDVRFKNEIHRIRDRGGIIVRLDRSGYDPGDPHISEQEWRSVEPDVQYTFPAGGFELMKTVAESLDRRLRGAR